MKLLIVAFLIVVLLAALNAPAHAQTSLIKPACDLGQYWLVRHGDRSGIWVRQGDKNTFNAYWIRSDISDESEVTTIGFDGPSVTAIGKTKFGDKCQYTGKLAPDGYTVTGTSTCLSGENGGQDWYATIMCGAPVITWSENATTYRAAKGEKFSFTCMPNGIPGSLWGTTIYTDDSSICTAAAYAGLLTTRFGGTVALTILSGQESYRGGVEFGITSSSYDRWQGSYQLEGATKDIPVINWQFSLVGYRGRNGSEYTFRCIGNSQPGSITIWGTDTYTDDSSVCTAAMHAGVITADGGQVTVTIRPGQASYPGSTQNGISSSDWGGWEGGYTIKGK
jgi:hypothetical protein